MELVKGYKYPWEFGSTYYLYTPFKLQQYNDDWQEYLNLCEKEILEYEHKWIFLWLHSSLLLVFLFIVLSRFRSNLMSSFRCICNFLSDTYILSIYSIVKTKTQKSSIEFKITFVFNVWLVEISPLHQNGLFSKLMIRTYGTCGVIVKFNLCIKLPSLTFQSPTFTLCELKHEQKQINKSTP